MHAAKAFVQASEDPKKGAVKKSASFQSEAKNSYEVMLNYRVAETGASKLEYSMGSANIHVIISSWSRFTFPQTI